jgi:hypothetical protein
MTTRTQLRRRRAATAEWFVLTSLLVLAVLALATAQAGDDTAPARHWSGYRELGEVAVVAPEDVEPIYETALRFYRPPRSQYRRLDVRLLPAAPGDTTTDSLSTSLASLLVEKLGSRFCISPDECHQGFGADLRVSSIYAKSPDTVRVIVGCRMISRWGAATDNGAQAFEIARGAKGWYIADRGGVATPQ